MFGGQKRTERVPAVVVLTGDHTLTQADMGRTWIFDTNGSARNVTLPAMSPKTPTTSIVNDSGSGHDIALKDSGGGTVATLTPGDRSTPRADDSGAVASE